MVKLRNACILMMSSLGMVAAVGCAERHNSIPSSARLVAEDQGSKSDFVAPSDGDVFVEDRSANKLLYSGKINEGERLRVDPMDDKLTINGQTVRDQKIRDMNNVRVFFRPERRADVAGSRTVVVPVQPAPQPQQQRNSGDSEIIVQPRGGGDSDADTIRVRPGANADSKVTVEPGEDGSKVTIERDAK